MSRALTCLFLSTLLAGSATAQEAPTPTQRAVQQLSLRHHPGCDAVLATLGSDADASLVEIAEAPSSIPWVPVRAAACLAPRPHAAEAVARWADQRAYQGLVQTVLDRLDAHPPERAIQIAERALRSPLAPAFRDRIAASPVSEVRALLR